jgi:hypothetical protein
MRGERKRISGKGMRCVHARSYTDRGASWRQDEAMQDDRTRTQSVSASRRNSHASQPVQISGSVREVLHCGRACDRLAEEGVLSTH